MHDWLLEELLAARRDRRCCALVTVAATTGSAPRHAGAKMLVFADGQTLGTVGGGRFEALVIEQARTALAGKLPVLKSYPLHEACDESFGAICGGEVTVLIEPQVTGEALHLIGAGHCAKAIARLAIDCGLHVTVVDDRRDILADLESAHCKMGDVSPTDYIAGRTWQRDEALVIVSRNYEIDREALAAALRCEGIGYIGMIGSRRKVRRVFDELLERGVNEAALQRVFAPIGLDIGADSPAEIAVSVIAEVLKVLRGRTGGHMQM